MPTSLTHLSSQAPLLRRIREVIAMPSGDEDVYEQLAYRCSNPLPTRSSTKANLGMGSTCKLVNNMITLAVRQVVAEGLTLERKSWPRSRCPDGSRKQDDTRHSKRRIRANRLPRQIRLRHHSVKHWRRKDISLANELARELNVPHARSQPSLNRSPSSAATAVGETWTRT